MSRRSSCSAGDGVGPEVTAEAVRVLESGVVEVRARPRVRGRVDRRRRIRRGGQPAAARRRWPPARRRPRILLGAVGGPKWDAIEVSKRRRSRACSAIRKALGLFANLAAGHRRAGARGRVAAEAGEAARRRHPRDSRAHGRHLFRQARPHRDRGVRHLRVQRGRDRARLPRRGEARDGARRKKSRRSTRRTCSTRRGSGARSRRACSATSFPSSQVEHLLVDAAAMHLLEPPGRLRRDGHREHVRRHPDRRGLDARGLDGLAAVGVARRRRARASTSRSTAPRPTSRARASRTRAARS